MIPLHVAMQVLDISWVEVDNAPPGVEGSQVQRMDYSNDNVTWSQKGISTIRDKDMLLLEMPVMDTALR